MTTKRRLHGASCAALALALAAGCAATETGGSMAQPEAPKTMFFDGYVLPTRIHEVVAAHRPCALQWEFDGPMAIAGPETVERYEWSPAGALLRYQRSNLVEGVDDNAIDYEYDEDGRLVRASWDFDGDGGFDASVEHGYDDAGRLGARELFEADELRRRESFVYDDDGKLTHADSFGPTSAEPSLRIEPSYDGDGALSEEAFDYEVDGSVDWRFGYRFDADGQLSAIRYDFEGDGSVTESVEMRWETGLRLSETHLYRGEVAYTIDYGYDAGGRLATVGYQHTDTPELSWRAQAVYDCGDR